MGYRKEERETVLVYSEETNEWMVYSCVPKHIRKLKGLCDITVIESKNGKPIAVKGKLSEKQVVLKRIRNISDEQRRKASERMKKRKNG